MRQTHINYLFVMLMMATLMLSCNESDIGAGNATDQLLTDQVTGSEAKQEMTDSPQKVFSDFQEMIGKVQRMSREEIEKLSDEEVLEIGKPILRATKNTVKLSDKTLQELKAPAAEMADRIRSISKKQYNELSSKFLQVI